MNDELIAELYTRADDLFEEMSIRITEFYYEEMYAYFGLHFKVLDLLDDNREYSFFTSISKNSTKIDEDLLADILLKPLLLNLDTQAELDLGLKFNEKEIKLIKLDYINLFSIPLTKDTKIIPYELKQNYWDSVYKDSLSIEQLPLSYIPVC